jgi:hypothetical protein
VGAWVGWGEGGGVRAVPGKRCEESCSGLYRERGAKRSREMPTARPPHGPQKRSETFFPEFSYLSFFLSFPFCSLPALILSLFNIKNIRFQEWCLSRLAKALQKGCSDF